MVSLFGESTYSQRALLDLRLTTAEKETFVRASRWVPAPELASALGDMLDPRRVQLRRLAAELLMDIDTTAAAQALRPHVPTGLNLARKLRYAAFLGRHGFDDGYPFAIEHLSERGYLEAALEAIAGIAKPGTAEQLLDIYSSSNDNGWKRAAVRGLGLLRHAAFADELVALTRDQKHPLAAAALLARAVEIAPGRLPVHAKHNWPVARPGVDVVDAERAAFAIGNVGVVGREGEARQVRKAFVGRAQGFHGLLLGQRAVWQIVAVVIVRRGP